MEGFHTLVLSQHDKQARLQKQNEVLPNDKPAANPVATPAAIELMASYFSLFVSSVIPCLSKKFSKPAVQLDTNTIKNSAQNAKYKTVFECIIYDIDTA